MKLSRHASAVLAALGIVAVAGSSAAWSQEELVMPFACDARAAQVRLTPAPQQAYRIYGNREKWLFRYCSPNAPDRCHHWMLHQFDVDCGGIRVPWIRVAEASASDRRAWVEDGRMTLKLGAAEASPREERMARRRWWWRQRGAYPADERFEGQIGPHSEMVELPPGFAPVLGTRAQFVGAPREEISSWPEESGTEIAAAAPSKAPSPAQQKSEAAAQPSQPKSAASQPIKPPAPTPAKREPAKATEAAEQQQPKASVPLAKEQKAAAAPASPAKAAEAPSGTSVTPTIINRPKAAGAPSVGASAEAIKNGEDSRVGAEVPAAARENLAPTAAPAAAPETARQEPTQAQPQSSQIATGSLRDRDTELSAQERLDARMLTIGFVLFGVLAASSFVIWLRRQERARLGTIVRRDIASVSFGGEPRAAPLPAPLGAHSIAAHPTATEIAYVTAPSGTDLDIPSSPQEALQALGASPDASLDVIKKIVDGLRQSWHPDLAKSDEDRRYREQRVKQINVAWDILSGRRSAA